MATSAIAPREWDAQGNPVQGSAPTPPREWDASGNPVGLPDTGSLPVAQPAPQQSTLSELVDMGKLGTSLVLARMLGAEPSFTYNNYDSLEKGLSQYGDFKARMGKAADVKDDPLYMMMKHRGPEPFESHDMLENFVHDVSEFIGDPALYGPAIFGAPSVGFALDAGLRKALTDHYQKGDVKSFGDLSGRVASTLWEAAKGLAIGKAMGVAGDLPVPKMLAGSPTASAALRGMYQASAMEVAGSILNLHAPTLESFERNAVMVGGFGLIAHGVQGAVNAKQGLMDVYAKDGTTPEQTVEKLKAQPPVKPEMRAGLQPAIRITAMDGSKQVLTGDDATHSDLAERHMGARPISIDELEADPKLADKVLSQPATHEQSVIDRAYEMKVESGEATTDLPPKSDLKSGRGFVTPSGDYLNRSQAKRWVKENEPEFYEMWKLEAGGEKDSQGKATEFHSQDYKNAVDRMNGRDLMEGETNYTGMTPENVHRIVSFRKDLNEAKADLGGKGWAENLRTFFIGQKDMRTAIANDLRRSLRKVLPDGVDRQALTFMRDFRGDEQGLQTMLTAIKDGDVATLQARLDVLKNQGANTSGLGEFEQTVTEESVARLREAIPAIEKALAPTPEMQAVDGELTKYAQSTFEEARSLGIFDSSIPPEKYITHILREADAEESTGGLGRPKLATSTPYGKQRTYPTTIDAMIAGKVPRTLDALDAIAVYGDRHATAVATRLWATELKNTELGKYGTGKNIPSDWMKMGEGRLFEYTGVDAKTGETFTTAFYAPKKIVEAMRPITERKVMFQGPLGQKFRQVQSYLKSAWLGLSLFHTKALTFSAMNNMGLTNFWKAVAKDIDSPESQRMTESAAADGVITARARTPGEVYRGMEGVTLADTPSRMDVVRNLYGIKKLNEWAAANTRFMFDVIQTKYKVPDFHTQVAAWMGKHPEATQQETFAARRNIAKEVNAVYGGLNWEALGWGPNAVELARAIFLAPDWTFSNVYNLKYAFGGGPGGKSARAFWFRSTATGLAMTQAMSLAVTGQTSKNHTSVYLGKDKNGKEMYVDWFFVGAPKDFVTQINAWQRDGAIKGTADFVVNKTAPLIGTGAREWLNKDWSGKPIIKPKQSFGEKTARQVGFGAGEVLPAPFAIKDAIRMLTDPDKDYTYKDFISELAGSTVYHEGGDKKEGRVSVKGTSRGGKFTVRKGQ